MATPKSKIPTAKLVTITPEMAEEMLARNTRNRNVRQRLVDRYAEEMINDRWTVGPSNIAEDTNGDIVDGQHRLLACIKANKPFTTWLMSGVDPSSAVNIDTGAKRQLGDVLKMRGYMNVNVLASSVVLGWRWDVGRPMVNDMPTAAVALDWLEVNPDITESMGMAKVMHRSLGISQSATAVFHYRLREFAEERDAFLKDVESGVLLKDTDPALALRRWIGKKRNTRNQYVRQGVYLALLIKAWNAWVLGKPTKVIVFRQGGRRETFPELLGIDGLALEWAGKHEIDNTQVMSDA